LQITGVYNVYLFKLILTMLHESDCACFCVDVKNCTPGSQTVLCDVMTNC